MRALGGQVAASSECTSAFGRFLWIPGGHEERNDLEQMGGGTELMDMACRYSWRQLEGGGGGISKWFVDAHAILEVNQCPQSRNLEGGGEHLKTHFRTSGLATKENHILQPPSLSVLFFFGLAASGLPKIVVSFGLVGCFNWQKYPFHQGKPKGGPGIVG